MLGGESVPPPKTLVNPGTKYWAHWCLIKIKDFRFPPRFPRNFTSKFHYWIATIRPNVSRNEMWSVSYRYVSRILLTQVVRRGRMRGGGASLWRGAWWLDYQMEGGKWVKKGGDQRGLWKGREPKTSVSGSAISKKKTTFTNNKCFKMAANTVPRPWTKLSSGFFLRAHELQNHDSREKKGLSLCLLRPSWRDRFCMLLGHIQVGPDVENGILQYCVEFCWKMDFLFS